MTLLLWLVIAVIPGVAVIRMLRLFGSLAMSAAIAAPVSFGLIYLVGLVSSRLALPVLAVSFTALGVLVACWLIVEAVRWRRVSAVPEPVARDDQSTPGRLPSGAAVGTQQQDNRTRWWHSPQQACSVGLLTIAIVGGVALWTGLHSSFTVPVGWDAMHLGYFARQIFGHDTLNATIVLSSDPAVPDGTAGFYPLAASLVTALIHSLSGSPISAVMLASTTALGGVILPCGVYALCSRLAPRLPLVAGFGALASVLPANLLLIESTGRMTAALGLMLVPAAVATIIPPEVRSSATLVVKFGVVGVLSIVGIIGVHTSELPTVIGLAVAAAVGCAWQSGRWRQLASWLALLVGIAAVTAVVLVALIPGVNEMLSERTGSFTLPGSGGTSTLQRAVKVAVFQAEKISSPQGVWSMLAAVGCLFTIHRRWRPLVGVAVGYVGFGLFYVALVTGHTGPFGFLADAWYRDPGRMLWVFAVLGAIPAGVALAVIAMGIRGAVSIVAARAAFRSPTTRTGPVDPGVAVIDHQRQVTANGSGRRWISVTVAVALVVAALPVFIVPPVRYYSELINATDGPVGPDYQLAFAYLAHHVASGERVLDDLENRGEMWMYVDNGVPMLLGNPPLLGLAPDSWKERLYLRARLGDIASDGCVADLIQKYHVTYVFYGNRRMSSGRPTITLDILENPTYFRQVFTVGDARVFQILPIANAAPCTTEVTSQYPWSNPGNAH